MPCAGWLGWGWLGKQSSCKQGEICMSGPEGSWVCLAELLSGHLCIFPLTLGQGFSARDSVQTYQEGNLVCGEAGVLQESTGPSEGMLQSEDTAHDKMPEN